MIIVILGPTGVGKTKLSIELAKKLNGEIINGDSTQVYKEMNIGTAKVREEEKENIPHHLFSFKNVDEEYTVYEYQKDARNKIIKLKKQNKIPIIVGGSNLYLSALLYDYKFNDEEKSIRELSLTNEEIYNELITKHPNINIDCHNRQRLIRAYNKYIINNEEYATPSKMTMIYSDVILIGLTTDREKLYNIINIRVDKMIEDGLLNEVKTLLDKYGETKELKTAIGYKELINYFNNQMALEEAIDLIKKNSRHYAKRQYTWLNNKMDVNWFQVNFINFDTTVKEVLDFIEKR